MTKVIFSLLAWEQMNELHSFLQRTKELNFKKVDYVSQPLKTATSVCFCYFFVFFFTTPLLPREWGGPNDFFQIQKKGRIAKF